MNEELFNYVKSFIKKENDNTYYIKNSDDQYFDDAQEELQLKTIKAKEEFANSGKSLNIDDLYLVRTNSIFPYNMEYKSYKNNGKYIKFNNPLENFFSYDSYLNDLETEIKDNLKLLCPIHRDTVHYTINGLVSNPFGWDKFTTRECVVIEPFNEHVSDRLVNINPVDTFIDIGNVNEKISKNATFIFSKNVYLDLPEEVKNKIVDYKKYIYDEDDFKVDKKTKEKHLLTFVTDIVLCHNNVLPLHSRGQATISTDYLDEIVDENEDEIIEHSDEEYNRIFQNLIDKLSIEMFGISYYNTDEELYDKRGYYRHVPGVFHDDTRYYDEEKIKNIENQKELLQRYFDYLHLEMNIPDDIISGLNNYLDIVYTPDKSFPITRHINNNNELKNYINNTNLSQFIEVTNEFNKNEKSRLDNIRLGNSLDANNEEKTEKDIKK